MGSEDARGQLGVALYPQLLVHASHVGMDGVRRDVESPRNLLLTIGQKELAADLALA